MAEGKKVLPIELKVLFEQLNGLFVSEAGLPDLCQEKVTSIDAVVVVRLDLDALQDALHVC